MQQPPFQLDDITAAHAAVKSGADFPAYAQALAKMGVERYDNFVADGHTVYFGVEGFELQAPPKYRKKRIARISDRDRFKHYLKSHQRGQTDYPTFCKHSAETGVEKWTVDLSAMTCSYYNLAGELMQEEQIRG